MQRFERPDRPGPGFRCFVLLLIASAYSQASIKAQDALKDRVDQLIERLGSEDDAQAAKAQEALIKLGDKILPLLPASGNSAGSERAGKRLQEIRKSLDGAGNRSTGAAKVNLTGESLRLSDVMKALQRQTGNTLIDLREQNGQVATNPSIALDLKDRPFLEALDEIAEKAGLSLNYYNAEGAIGYLEGAAMMPDAAKPAPQEKYVAYVDAFRIALNQLLVSRDFATGASTANLRMEFVWEPRLRPLAMKLDTSKIEARDDKGRKITASVSGESMELAIRPENPIVDLNLNLSAPPRDAAKIESLSIETELTLPTKTLSLAVPDITKQDSKAEMGQASMRILEFEADPPVWKVRAELTTPRPAGAENLDSYRESGLAPTVALTKADSARIPLNGGFSVGPGNGPGKLVYELLFVDITGRPEDHGLVVEIPGELKTVPVRWTFQAIPLP
ncbi:hypothetical protein GC170_17655 [bacterium]|nr:hypothetical protein [bacterium]